MMHYLRTPLALLLLGAVINVSVAWGCSIFLRPHEGEVSFQLQTDAKGHAIGKTISKRFGRVRESVHPAQERQVPAAFAKAMGRVQWLTQGERGSVDYAGWPLICLMCRNDRADLALATDEGWIAFDGDKSKKLSGGLALKPWATGSGAGVSAPTWRAIPLKPVWVGMMVNSLFFAALLAPFWLGRLAIRHFVRAWRKQCLACAYPIGTSPVCTECGRPVKLPQTRKTPIVLRPHFA